LKAGAAGTEDDRIGDLVAQAQALAAKGEHDQASLVYGRVLVHDPGNTLAGAGLERSQDAVAEAARRNEARFDEARAALAAGDPVRARELLDGLLGSPGSPDGAQALLDRLDERPGVLLASPAGGREAAARPGQPREPARGHWRNAFVAFWAGALVLFAGSLAFSWERLLVGLVAPPSPATLDVAAGALVPQPSLADLSLREARERLDSDDPMAALSALDRIQQVDAQWPFAQQLRIQARKLLAARPKEDRR
jgi:hypothetical protein